MNWTGAFFGSFFGNWFSPLVQYISRAKRGISYVVTTLSELFVAKQQTTSTVRMRGRQD